MRSRAAAGFIAIAGIFLIEGFAFQRWELVSLLLPLSALLAILLYVGKPPKLEVEARWVIGSERVMGGDVLDIALSLTNQGEWAGMAIADVSIAQDAEILYGSSSIVISLKSGQEERINYRIRFPRRGVYVLGPVRLRALDIMGINETVRDLDVCATVRVAPRVYDMKPKNLVPSRVRLATGNIDSRLLGPGLEFHSLRDYLSGDDFKRVNWKATARTDSTIVNQYMSQRSCDVAVVLDAVGMNEDHLEGAVEMAAGLSTYFLKQRDRVGLAVFGQYAKVIRPDYGKRQMHRILESLIDVRVDPERVPFKLVQFLDRYFLRDALVILITSVEKQEVIATTEQIIRNGRHVVVLSPHQEPLSDDLHGRMGKIRREDDAYSMRRYCRVEEWDVSRPPIWLPTRGRA